MRWAHDDVPEQDVQQVTRAAVWRPGGQCSAGIWITVIMVTGNMGNKTGPVQGKIAGRAEFSQRPSDADLINNTAALPAGKLPESETG